MEGTLPKKLTYMVGSVSETNEHEQDRKDGREGGGKKLGNLSQCTF